MKILSYFIYGLVWLVSFLPMRTLYIFSDFLYFLLYYLVKYRRKVVATNLRNAFPEKMPAELKTIEKKFYRNLSDTFVELYKPWHMSEKEMKRRYVFKNTAVLEKYFNENRSIIGVLGHYGNWEWMASFSLWMNQEIDFLTIYKPMHNKIFDRMMRTIRSRFGAIPVPKNEILRKIVEERRENRLFLAGFIADQTPNRGNLNFWMDFLNQDTAVLFGTEKIAKKFNLPVISLFARKIRRGYYEVEFIDLCDNPEPLEHGELTIMYMRLLEQQIKGAPEYWLWSHKRWKYTR